MKPKMVYLVLCCLGAVLPYSRFVPRPNEVASMLGICATAFTTRLEQIFYT